MSKKKKSQSGKWGSTQLRKLPLYEVNPFVLGSDLNPDTTKRTEVIFDGKQALINTETGEIGDNQIALARIKTVEADQFVKVYAAQMHVLFELGKPAQRVCEFVMVQISTRAINKGEVLLSHREYKKYFEGRTGGHINTFNRGLQELADKNLVARTTEPVVWFINPAIFFNGDRARFVTEIRRKHKTKQETLEDGGQERLLK